MLLGAVVFFLMRRPVWMGAGSGGGHAHRHGAVTLDALTGERIEGDPALRVTYGGRSYYFANAENRDRFNADPEQFAKAADAKAGKSHGGGHGCC